ncbi:CLIP domain-containing serine protease B9-like [Chironomus tepperi]|uniref:CLIP domain-containing serine protease B9-like n=1 Tax=Chironomus tepperi TaxID=113505 RepID=UPI00391F9516
MSLKILFLIALSSKIVFSAQIASIIIQEHFDQCGVMSSSAGLIQGGYYSKQNQFPWIAIISIKNESDDSWDQNGSGSLISRRHVLVKSRYISTLDENEQYMPMSTENIQIILGTTKYDDLSQEGSVKVGVSKIRLYPHTKRIARGFSVFNFAILTLAGDVTFSDYIKPVCLWNNQLNSKMHPGQQMMAVGYGRDLTGQISKTRKHVSVQVTSSNECATEYEDVLTQTKESRFFCVKEIMKDHGPCKFDTQLYVKIDSTWYLRGEMISSRIDLDTLQCYTSYPIAVEDISPYFDWIGEEIKDELTEIFVGSKKNKIIELVDVENIVKYEVN